MLSSHSNAKLRMSMSQGLATCRRICPARSRSGPFASLGLLDQLSRV
jgi:hypothetical protein